MTRVTDWIAEVRGRCEKATEGPWVATDKYTGAGERIQVRQSRLSYCVLSTRKNWKGRPRPRAQADSEFAAHARTDLPKALALLERADEMLSEAHLGDPILMSQAWEVITARAFDAEVEGV